MPLPLGVLRASAEAQPIMVELKSGDTLSGILVSCDAFMNLRMKDLVCTSRDGEQFWSMDTIYVRGNNVKLVRLNQESLQRAVTQQQALRKQRKQDELGKRPTGGHKGAAKGWEHNTNAHSNRPPRGSNSRTTPRA